MTSEHGGDRSATAGGRVLMAHGGGGEMTRRLVADHILPHFANPLLDPLDDAAVIAASGSRICFTTDASVVQPLEFPGGDIGRLAVCGTVNDLAVTGAVPRALSMAFVIEEGLELSVLDRIAASVAATAREAGVVVATGDTKVVERARGDGLMLSTAGVGTLRDDVTLGMDRIRPGDVVLISGPIAEHGLAILSAREGLAFETTLESDVAPLARLCSAVLDIGEGVRFLRDPTRGGLSGVLADVAEEAGLTVEIDESAVPLTPVARHASEMLGLDPMGVANEGKLVIVAAPDAAAAVLGACRALPEGRHAAVIGRIVESSPPLVELITAAGGRRIVQRPYGEELPRIC